MITPRIQHKADRFINQIFEDGGQFDSDEFKAFLQVYAGRLIDLIVFCLIFMTLCAFMLAIL